MKFLWGPKEKDKLMIDKTNKLKKELEDLGGNVFLIKADLNNSYQVQRLIKDSFYKMSFAS